MHPRTFHRAQPSPIRFQADDVTQPCQRKIPGIRAGLSACTSLVCLSRGRERHTVTT